MWLRLLYIVENIIRFWKSLEHAILEIKAPVKKIIIFAQM